MNENEIRNAIASVKQGLMSRRSFIQGMAAAGIAAPLASQILSWNDVAMADASLAYKPTRAGGGGPLKILLWQAPTLLNPHFATGTKDQDGSRLFYEPLACWDPDGNMKLVLAAEVPSIQNGLLAADGKSVTWKLKSGVKWHDGRFILSNLIFYQDQYAKTLMHGSLKGYQLKIQMFPGELSIPRLKRRINYWKLQVRTRQPS